MIAKKIDIENFKGFIKEEITFDDQLNVFIGANASGKTSLLEAIVKCLFKFTSYFTHQFIENESPTHHLFLQKKDINYQQNLCNIFLYLNAEGFKELIPFHIKKNKEVNDNIASDNLDWNQKRVLREFKEFFTKRVMVESSGIPIIKYYPVNRNYSKFVPPPSVSVFSSPQYETWDNIAQNNLSYSRFVEWFFEHENKELRLKREQNDLTAESVDLHYVRKAIKEAFKVLENKKYRLISNSVNITGSNKLFAALVLHEEDSNTKEQLENKSDGQKTIATLVADIAYNLAIANSFNLEGDILAAPGIVLIDEIESHLHPNWQRKIIPLLTELFPNIQFFITTHSPQVISSISSKHIFLCEDFKVSKINFKSKGLDSNNILKHIFNATDRPKEYVDLLEKFDQLMENEADIGKIEAIIQEVQKLEDRDEGTDISQLIEEMELQLEAYKFDLENEMDS